MDENERHYLVEADPHDDDAIPLYASPAIAGPDADTVRVPRAFLGSIELHLMRLRDSKEGYANTPALIEKIRAMLADAQDKERK